MTSGQLTNNTYAIRLDPGDEINASIAEFCQQNAIANAQLTGLGSIENPILAHYSIHTRKFSQRALEGVYEITSLSGNVGLIDDQPTPHIHLSCSDVHMSGFGGHLMNGACSATVEIILTAYPSQYKKLPNDMIGLNIWNLDV